MATRGVTKRKRLGKFRLAPIEPKEQYGLEVSDYRVWAIISERWRAKPEQTGFKKAAEK